VPGHTETNLGICSCRVSNLVPSELSPKVDGRGTALSWHWLGESDVNDGERNDFCGGMKTFYWE